MSTLGESRIAAQPPKEAAVETILNTGSGFLISWVMWVFVVAPLWGIPFDMGDSLGITLIFTLTTLLRSYIWRRLFNGRAVRNGING